MASNMVEPKNMEVLRDVFSQGLRQTSSLLSTLLNFKVSLEVQDIQNVSLNDLVSRYTVPYMGLKIGIANGTGGQGLMLFPHSVSWVLCDILRGNGGQTPVGPMGNEEMSMFAQIMTQFFNFLTTSISQALNKKITYSSSGARMFTMNTDLSSFISGLGVQSVICMTFKITIDNVLEEQFVQIVPAALINEFVVTAKSKSGKGAQNVEPLNLMPLDASSKASTGLGNILVDIPLQLSVELGRTRMILKELLELGVGSIIELDRLAGEPVDIMLNNKLLAKGEVVVIDEKLGVRVTHIVETNERM